MSRIGKIITEISCDPSDIDKFMSNQTPWPIFECKRDMALLYDKLMKLTAMQQKCLRMYYFEGMSQDEIAQELKISRSTVRTHIDRGVSILKNLCNKGKK